MSSMRLASSFLFAIAVAGCAPAATPVDLAAEKESLMQTDRDFSELSRETGAVAAFTHYLAEDALGLPAGGQPTFHRDSLVAGMGGEYTLTWVPQRAEVSENADMGWTWGRYEFRTMGPDGQERVSYGKYLNVWRKEADGTWSVVADIGNGNPKPAE